MAAVPLDAVHRVVTADTDRSGTFGASRRSSSTVPTTDARLSGMDISEKIPRTSAGISRPMMDTRSEMNGTAEMITKKDACAAETVI